MLTDEQLELRKNGIGASDVPAICGFDKYRTPTKVWIEHQRIGLLPPFEGNESTDWGDRLEAQIVKRYVEDGHIILKEKPDTMIHPRHEWAMATPDRIILDEPDGIPHLLEIKLTTVGKDWNDNKADGIPEHVFLQMQWQLFVTMLERCDVAALIADYGFKYRCWTIEKNQEIIDYLFDRVRDFWFNHILTGEPPDKLDALYLRTLFPENETGEMLPATKKLLEKATDLAGVKEAITLLEDQKEELENYFKSVIGNAEGIENICTYKANKKGTRIFLFNYKEAG